MGERGGALQAGFSLHWQIGGVLLRKSVEEEHNSGFGKHIREDLEVATEARKTLKIHDHGDWDRVFDE